MEIGLQHGFGLVRLGFDANIPRVSWKRKTAGGFMAAIGFMLSPLSWWNDLFINVPLAAAFAWIISLFYKPAFYASLFVGYWMTNVLGFVLMHKGAQKILSDTDKKSTRRELLNNIAISLLYTGVIFLLVKLGVLKPITAYWNDAPDSPD